MVEAKILNHIDREEIISKLLAGMSPNEIRIWLVAKYPDEKDKDQLISVSSISDFRKNYLNLSREATRLIKKEQKKKEMHLPHNANVTAFIDRADDNDEVRVLRARDTLLNSPAYRDKLKEVADAQLDAPRLMKELLTLLQSRIEVYYNEIASATTIGDTLKADKMFAEYVKLASDVLKDSKKVWDDYNAQPDEGTIDLDIVHQMVGVVRDVVKDSMNDLAPEIALEFMDRLNKRLTTLDYHMPKPKQQILEQVGEINKKILEIRKQAE
jgi:hypothetical protein